MKYITYTLSALIMSSALFAGPSTHTRKQRAGFGATNRETRQQRREAAGASSMSQQGRQPANQRIPGRGRPGGSGRQQWAERSFIPNLDR